MLPDGCATLDHCVLVIVGWRSDHNGHAVPRVGTSARGFYSAFSVLLEQRPDFFQIARSL